MSKRIIIVSGGTGGHIYPGLNIAYKLIEKGWDVRWIGSIDRMEADIIPTKGIKIYLIKFLKFEKKSIWSKIITLFKLIKPMYKSILIYKSYKPNIVLTMGSYISGPSGIAAWLCGIPLMIHEQNSVPGFTNNFLSKISKKNMQAYPNTFKNGILVGNPLSKEIIKLSLCKKKFLKYNNPLHLLIIGGSQGSNIINIIAIKLAKILKDKVMILHQIGKGNLKNISLSFLKKYEKKFYFITEYIYKMHYAYEWADIIISRSGAMTVSEISAIGLPAIFIPFKHKDNQQYFNALRLKKIGAAKIFDQNNLNINDIINTLLSWNKQILIQISKKSRSISLINSTELIYKEIKEYFN
ncbi:undecaprenyldiphospho-muramoylpentapeptide beta-N-acetylglucosaminyltransferase [Enterobacteriaceae endosymbiont of Plateumaris consimilis]|uniref:undecaprenyldiphospho-muramoylpentapeptide beta-N-acetylglucosaminyltransferase n=1 Tax=Enterobacteriaceae endosymbiont of Plateumaris consimilis TaxID=2675794 RepID=UPI001449FE31|nr:undecaprenyldiphospho-muramoylpentapeptide beta-N-acetylglucosaminyltransferase [Enterobacteriaceae endosymbiont of Plateumaris consimilis]QJC28555.1 undecaprenyldiphospho-muramoylpentapeptide beta-N-acetylglucosaminyltransferase [Enterobacteriaceae endosymbiont of Plateumaris consimilis]